MTHLASESSGRRFAPPLIRHVGRTLNGCRRETITTVGYGNWVPSGWDIKETDLQNRILYVNAISVPFMFVGGALFEVLIEILSNLLSHR